MIGMGAKSITIVGIIFIISITLLEAVTKQLSED
jgi:hypothetical protein